MYSPWEDAEGVPRPVPDVEDAPGATTVADIVLAVARVPLLLQMVIASISTLSPGKTGEPALTRTFRVGVVVTTVVLPVPGV